MNTFEMYSPSATLLLPSSLKQLKLKGVLGKVLFWKGHKILLDVPNSGSFFFSFMPFLMGFLVECLETGTYLSCLALCC